MNKLKEIVISALAWLLLIIGSFLVVFSWFLFFTLLELSLASAQNNINDALGRTVFANTYVGYEMYLM